ncbi:MAG TPA: ABC transporter permease, partial [Chryseolinea sp.]|nr:ABC transporter permease [Chryseolinea sp.]
MIRNYITIAIRSMMRNKRYTFINIAGLSVGVACCLLLALYIRDELSYDRHHKDADRIYRITSKLNFDKGRGPMETTSPPIAWGIKDEIPEFETVTRLVNPPGASQNLVRYEDNRFYEPNGYIADSTVFDIFTYDFIEGNAAKALTRPNSVVITTTLANKLFGAEPALDRVINITQNGAAQEFKITGVIRDLFNGHIKASFFISINSSGWAEYIRRNDVADEWAGQNFMLSYVKLTPGHSVETVISKMNTVFMKHGGEDLKALGFSKELGLQPLQDIYLRSTSGNQNPRITYLYVLASIAIFILLIACINFMNLSTAKAAKRANEVGLRKSLGAHRTALVIQFLGEALVIVFLAIAVSCIIVQLCLPLFNDVTGKHISLEGSDPWFIAAALMGITLVTGLMAGSYPAFYLSSFEPTNALKGKANLRSSNSLLRKSLVVFQFVIAITLVCGMFAVTNQLKYMQEQDLGFSPSHKIIIPLRTATAKQNYLVLRNAFNRLSTVKGVTATTYVP